MALVLVDDRETKSPVIDELRRLGVAYEVKRLDVADYDIGGVYGVERKTPSDFISSIIDRRLFDQATYLREAFEVPIIVVEGGFARALRYRRINPHAVLGALAALAETKISVIQTTGPRETAELIYVLARRLEKKRKPYVPPTKKRVIKMNTSIPVVQLNLLSSIPGISFEMADKILRHFKTPRRFFTAKPSELREVPGIGEKRVKKILAVLDTIYTPLHGGGDE